MQKVGVSICTHCMKETDEFCYYLPLLNVFFEVVENRLGHYMAVVPGNSNVKITIIGLSLIHICMYYVLLHRKENSGQTRWIHLSTGENCFVRNLIQASFVSHLRSIPAIRWRLWQDL